MKIFYDGDCYFCTNFVKLLKLQQIVGDVELISLRENGEEVQQVLTSGINVNSGFVVEHDGRVMHGAQAFHYLNTLTEPRNLLSRILFLIGRYPKLAKFLYPLMVCGRFLVLVFQGGALIDRERKPWEDHTSDGVGPRLVRLSALLLGTIGIARLLISGLYTPLTVVFVTVMIAAMAGSLCWMHLFRRAGAARDIYRRIRQADWRAVITYVIVWLTAVNLFDMVPFRRFAGFIAILPLIAVALDLYRLHHRSAGRVPAALPLVTLVFAFFPGLYLAPFYGGIFGWTAQVDRSKPVVVAGYKLVNQDGEEIWYNHEFFQPITQNGRFRRAFLSGIPDEAKFVQFMFDNYRRIYPMLETGRMPHEWALGHLAYPSHNLSDSNALDYVGRFEPSKITSIEYVSESYTLSGNLISKRNVRMMTVQQN